MPTDRPKINIDILSAEDEWLLQECALKQNPDVKLIHASPLGRYGYSGAEIFRAYFDEQKRGHPFVVKIDSKSKIEKEVAAINKIKIYFIDAISGHESFYSENKGAILYVLFAPTESDGAAKIVELKDVVYKLDRTDEEIVNYFEYLYTKSCKVAHQDSQISETSMKDQYKLYLRDRESDEKITTVLGGKIKSSPFEFLNAGFIDPRSFLDRGFRAPLRCSLSAVHGDLHPNNVVIGHDGHPKLIDFAWGHLSAHVLKDFVLMENSLRFLLFPSHVNLDIQRKVDEALLNEDGYDQISTIVLDSGLAAHYTRLACIIEIIRKHARKVGGPKYAFDEYLAAQFLMLYGLLKYPDYQFHIGLRALGMIANYLASTRFGFK